MADLVEHYRARALALVPDAEDGVSYGMPALRYRGRPLVSVIETKAGYSLYPYSSEIIAAHAEGLAGVRTTKGGAQFTAADPVPDAVFDSIVVARRDQIDAALGKER